MTLLRITPAKSKRLRVLVGPMRSSVNPASILWHPRGHKRSVFFPKSEQPTSRKMVMHGLCIIIGKALAVGILFLSICIFLRIVPPRYPRNIPAVPFWVTLLSLVRDIDQEDIYRRHIQKPLQTHGVCLYSVQVISTRFSETRTCIRKAGTKRRFLTVYLLSS